MAQDRSDPCAMLSSFDHTCGSLAVPPSLAPEPQSTEGRLFEHEPCNSRSRTGRAGNSPAAGNISFRDRGRTALQAHPARGRAGRRFHLLQSGRRARTAVDAFEPGRQSDWKPSTPHVLYSNRTPGNVEERRRPHRRELLQQRLFQRASNVARYGDPGKDAANRQSNLETAVRNYGMDRWSFNVDACFNVFMTRNLRRQR